jgi:hypothetical protein
VEALIFLAQARFLENPEEIKRLTSATKGDFL